MNAFREKTWLLIFACCFIYWTYLILHTRMSVVFDSIDYENTGKMIYHAGWIKFFQTGPQREPFYPALIAMSMALADRFAIDYQLVLRIFQVGFLFFTQVLLLVLLRKLKVCGGILKTAVFYFGISPALINAAFSEYYEIVTFPFVVAVVLLAGELWDDIFLQKKYRWIAGKAILFGACFSLLALGRGIFQYLFYIFILPFCLALLWAFLKHRGEVFRRGMIFVATACLIFYSSTTFVKTMNLHYNGQYVLCKSHLSILLGSAYKRSQPVSPLIIAAHIASIPGDGVCQLFFSKKECDYADWYGSDQFRVTEAGQRMAMIPKDHQELGVFRLTLQKIMAHPFQYAFFSVVEAFKMPFWESTRIGFVDYPKSLGKLYIHPMMRFGLRLFVGLMSIAGFLFVIFDLGRRVWEYSFTDDEKRSAIMLFFAWGMITGYTFFYSLCYVITRYALPIASLYIVCISVATDAVIRRRRCCFKPVDRGKKI